MRSLVPVLVLVLGLCATAPGLRAQSLGPDERAASAAAEAWLVHIDAGRYEESWSHASPTVRGAVTAQQWEAAVRQALDPMGPLVGREESAVTPMTDPPGAPPGRYMAVAYRSGFAAAPVAVETVVLRQEDGEWKVVGYFVRPA